jgi:hypothetical protein
MLTQAIEKAGNLKEGVRNSTPPVKVAADSSSSSSSRSAAKAPVVLAAAPAAPAAAAAPVRQPIQLNIDLTQLPAIQETSEIIPIRIYPDERLSKLMNSLAAITGYRRTDLKLKIGKRVANNDLLTIQDSGLVSTNARTKIYLVIAWFECVDNVDLFVK